MNVRDSNSGRCLFLGRPKRTTLPRWTGFQISPIRSAGNEAGNRLNRQKRTRPYWFFSPADVSALFDAAAALHPANLVVGITTNRPGIVMLPRLDHTKSITLDVHGVNLVPPQDQDGDMPALESLSLRRYDAVLAQHLHRFSALRSLSVSDSPRDFIFVLPFLEELFLMANVRLRQVCISAPMLKKMTFHARQGVADQFFVQCLAPKVVDLSWQCTDRVSNNVRFGDIWSPRTVTIKTSEPLGQLQHTPRSKMYTLSLSIWEWKVFVEEGAAPSFDHYISSLFRGGNNNFSVLELHINSCGHVYGAMVLHLLEVYTLIEILKVDLRKFQARSMCSANCPCIHLNNWTNQTISLTALKEMEIKGVRGEDHEIDMLKAILRSASRLERVAFTFSLKSEQRIRRFASKIHSILKAHPSVDCQIFRCSGEQVLSA